MSTKLLTVDIWPTISKSVIKCRAPCQAAVAYFGKGASELLPLTKGSKLVVDASEHAVASGQTHPGDLLELVKRGIFVFSVENLHAKVYVVGNRAFVGSANTSNRSANQLVEAMLVTNERSAVTAARRFVRANCLHELTPKRLAELQKVYHPPKFPNSGSGANKGGLPTPTLPRMFIVRLRPEVWSENEQAAHDADQEVAHERRTQASGYLVDGFRYWRACPFGPGDVVLQVMNEGDRTFVSPPGTVLHKKLHHDGGRPFWFVFAERSKRRRRTLSAFSKSLGVAANVLNRGGLVRNQAAAHAVFAAWRD